MKLGCRPRTSSPGLGATNDYVRGRSASELPPSLSLRSSGTLKAHQPLPARSGLDGCEGARDYVEVLTEQAAALLANMTRAGHQLIIYMMP